MQIHIIIYTHTYVSGAIKGAIGAQALLLGSLFLNLSTAFRMALLADQLFRRKVFVCSVLQCVSQCVAVCRRVLQCVAVCHSVPQCVAVCRSVLQCAAVCCEHTAAHCR